MLCTYKNASKQTDSLNKAFCKIKSEYGAGGGGKSFFLESLPRRALPTETHRQRSTSDEGRGIEANPRYTAAPHGKVTGTPQKPSRGRARRPTRHALPSHNVHIRPPATPWAGLTDRSSPSYDRRTPSLPDKPPPSRQRPSTQHPCLTASFTSTSILSPSPQHPDARGVTKPIDGQPLSMVGGDPHDFLGGNHPPGADAG